MRNIFPTYNDKTHIYLERKCKWWNNVVFYATLSKSNAHSKFLLYFSYI